MYEKMLNVTSHHKMQVKTTMRYHHIHVKGLSLINQQTTSVVRRQRKCTLMYIWLGMRVGAATVENRMEFTQKLKVEMLYDPVIPLLGIYPKEPKTLIQRQYAL